MYYRYKSKKRSGQKYKVIGVIVLITIIVYLGYKFKDSFQVWKYTLNKINTQIKVADKTKEIEIKKAILQKALAMCDDYEESNPLSADPYYIEARVCNALAEIECGSDFTTFVIDDKRALLTVEARMLFQRTLQNAAKGSSFDQKTRPEDKILLVMAKSYFYLGYYSPEEIKKTLDLVRSPSALPGIDDKRFYGLMKIVGGDPDGGVRFLVDSADIQRDHQGKLFLASAYTLAKQYTNAIVEYKSILESSPEPQTMVKARIGLGRVYLTQQLAREALQQFDEALRNDQQNISAKILSARAYLSMGDKVTAKRLCNDLVTHNVDNAEIREILKLTQ